VFYRPGSAQHFMLHFAGARRLRAVSNLRDDEDVPLICPTCQNVFAGSLKASMPATIMLLCMGLFSIF